MGCYAQFNTSSEILDLNGTSTSRTNTSMTGHALFEIQ